MYPSPARFAILQVNGRIGRDLTLSSLSNVASGEWTVQGAEGIDVHAVGSATITSRDVMTIASVTMSATSLNGHL